MTLDNISGVEIVHWNPRRNKLPYPINRLQIGARVNNFGDLLGPVIARRIVEEAGLRPLSSRTARLLTVGSIMGLAEDRDVIWGTGVNGKVSVESHRFTALDVRAVRGPRTASFLRARGIDVPDVFGDPALLIPKLYPEWVDKPKRRKLGVLPNFHDLDIYRGHSALISPLASPARVIETILECERVVASSLHGVIIAEAFGIPAVAIESGVEHPFKYRDYFEGSGRLDVPLASDLAEAVQLVEHASWPTVAEAWTAAPLLDAFPQDLWSVPVDTAGHGRLSEREDGQ